jgi:hypothetical protein
MIIKYTKWDLNIPNVHTIFQYYPFQGPPKYTQIGNFGIKIIHLATLGGTKKNCKTLQNTTKYRN